MKLRKGNLKMFGDIFEFLSKPGVGISTFFQEDGHRASKVGGSSDSGEHIDFNKTEK